MPNEELPQQPQDPSELPGDTLGIPSVEAAEDTPRSSLLPSVVELPQDSTESSQEFDPEASELHAMVREYPEIVGKDFEIIKVGESGYVVRLGKRPPNPKGDWIWYDVDDTAIKYTQAKKARLAHYTDHLKDKDITLGKESASDLLDTTDVLARWKVHGRTMYHIDAHLELMAWATEHVSQLDVSDRDQWVSGFKAHVDELIAKQPESTPDSLPFFFRDGELVFKPTVPGAGRTREMYEDVFDAMIRPERNQDLLDTMVELDNDTQNEAFRLNQGILTYGSPDFQLRKTLEVMKDMHAAGTELPVSSIFLSKVKKGAFLKELLKFDPRTNPDAPQSNIAEDVFNDIPHAIMLVDDDPKEVESFVSLDGNYENFRYDLDLMGVRYHREGTKNYMAVGAYGGFDSRVGFHRVDNKLMNLRQGIYQVLNTQVAPPPESAAGRDGRWGNSLSKWSFYKHMIKILDANYDPEYPNLHDGIPSYVSMETYRKMELELARTKHREAEYAAGHRLPFDVSEINQKYYAA